MELPNELRIAIENLTQLSNHSELKRDAQALSIRYRTEGGSGKRLLTQNNEAAAYSVARMPATYGAVLNSLKYALEIAKCNPRSLLDVGAGTGAATWAANTVLDLKTIVCLEREDAMRHIGKRLMAKTSSIPLREAKWLHHDLNKDQLSDNADLVIASYLLNELGEDHRIKVVNKLWSATNMMILFVEPGTPKGYSNIMEARDFLIQRGAHIAAPCPHTNECQMVEGDWCHFKCRVPRSRLHRQVKNGEVPYEDEKFIYLAMTREKNIQADSRIIRHPFVRKGRVTLDICSADGINKIDVYKREGDLYKKARKAKCGDQISIK